MPSRFSTNYHVFFQMKSKNVEFRTKIMAGQIRKNVNLSFFMVCMFFKFKGSIFFVLFLKTFFLILFFCIHCYNFKDRVRIRGCGNMKRKNISLEGVAVLWNNFFQFRCKVKFSQGEHQKHLAGGGEGREDTKAFIFPSDKSKSFSGGSLV